MITKELVEQWAKETGTGAIPITALDLTFLVKAATYGAEQREAELMAVGMEPNLYVNNESGQCFAWGAKANPEMADTHEAFYTAEQIAAARLQGAEAAKHDGHTAENWHRLAVDRLNELDRLRAQQQTSEVNQGLLNKITGLEADVAHKDKVIENYSADAQHWFNHCNKLVEFARTVIAQLPANTYLVAQARAAIAAAEAHTGAQAKPLTQREIDKLICERDDARHALQKLRDHIQGDCL